MVRGHKKHSLGTDTNEARREVTLKIGVEIPKCHRAQNDSNRLIKGQRANSGTKGSKKFIGAKKGLSVLRKPHLTAISEKT